MCWLSIVNHSVYFTAKQKKCVKVNIYYNLCEILGFTKAFSKNVFKEDRRRSDTVLVLAINDVCWGQALTQQDLQTIPKSKLWSRKVMLTQTKYTRPLSFFKCSQIDSLFEKVSGNPTHYTHKKYRNKILKITYTDDDLFLKRIS